MEISIVNNMIHFMREGEIGTISALKRAVYDLRLQLL